MTVSRVLGIGRKYLTSEFTFREQFAYGHREILLRYTGLPTEAVFSGRIQHGWDPLDWEVPRPFRPLLRREAWQWVWAPETEQLARRRGVKKVTAIGAPWLYLLAMENAPSQREQSKVLVMPGHYDELTRVERHTALARAASRAFASVDKLAILHGFDFLTKEIRDVYRDRDIDIECAGWPTIAQPPRRPSTAIGDRVRFLYNLRQLMLSGSAVITDRVGTHVMYAGSLGLNVAIWPPSEDGSHAGHDNSQYSRLAGAIDNIGEWERQVLGRYYREFIPGEVLTELVMRYLGANAVMSPQNLCEVLEWNLMDGE
jgi:hypothetical protein